ncbi:MAG: hypothetical protein AAF940_02645, partial [Pseudomonadota bacterium]
MAEGRDKGQVNRASQRTSSLWRFALFAVLVVGAAVTAGWYWTNRDREPLNLTVATGPLGSDAYVL